MGLLKPTQNGKVLQQHITVVTVDTKFHPLTKRALERTIDLVTPRDVIVLSDQSGWPSGATHIEIAPFYDVDTYNETILKSILSKIKTTHCMIVQYDGFPLERHLWENRFLDYDYIGAPWPHFDFHRVGNGGFSLRSRRLMEAAAAMSEFRAPREPEDVFICRSIRPLLESKYALRFSPEDVALRFSFESPGHPKRAFGFHGVLNLLIAYRNELESFFALASKELITRRRAELFFGTLFLSSEERATAQSMLSNHP
jgi:hypothetical protein